MSPAATYVATAIKLKKEAWQPAVFLEGEEEPLETAQAVRTKKEAEDLAAHLLEAMRLGAEAERPERPSEAAREDDEHEVDEQAVAKAPTPSEVAAVTHIPSAASLVDGLGEARPNPKGTYHRLFVGDRAIGYSNPRRDGVLLDFTTDAVEGAPTPLRRGLKIKGSRASLHVNAKNAEGARALLEHLAQMAQK